jgi:lipopolysaccharide cholinephosphotransferase
MSEFNLQPETRDGYFISEKMKKIWNVQINLLQKFLEVCHQHQLRCWVGGGTMLGAVRHHGYIPWDDDIDVMMPRPDYDRLLKIGIHAFSQPYFLQSAYTDTDYFRGHAQLRYSNTAAIRPSESYRSFHQGIFIDIFVLDGVPDNDKDLQHVIKTIHKTYHLLKAAHLNILYSGRWGQIGRKIKSHWMIRKWGYQQIFRHTEELLRMTPIEKSNQWAPLSFSKDKFIFDHHIFRDTLWMNFENIRVPVPIGYDQFLKKQYGENYMTPIKAPSCHGDIIFDTNHSYSEIRLKVFREFKHKSLKRLLIKIHKR